MAEQGGPRLANGRWPPGAPGGAGVDTSCAGWHGRSHMQHVVCSAQRDLWGLGLASVRRSLPLDMRAGHRHAEARGGSRCLQAAHVGSAGAAGERPLSAASCRQSRMQAAGQASTGTPQGGCMRLGLRHCRAAGHGGRSTQSARGASYCWRHCHAGAQRLTAGWQVGGAAAVNKSRVEGSLVPAQADRGGRLAAMDHILPEVCRVCSGRARWLLCSTEGDALCKPVSGEASVSAGWGGAARRGVDAVLCRGAAQDGRGTRTTGGSSAQFWCMRSSGVCSTCAGRC